MNEKFLKPYDPKETEERIYKLWEESGFFNPDTCVEKGVTDKNAQPFSIVLPPPNVTGTLHMGSSLMLAVEDTIVRFNRMRGKKTLWIPGMDHAAIATQSKVEKILEKEESKRKTDLGREEFLKRVEAFAQSNRETMTTQLKALGSSLDWSREAYTLDKKREIAVYTAFKQMFDEGLIYRGHRIVNWDPKGQTTISDDEIVHEERKGKIYTFKYSSDFPIPIATTRPETKVGDTAVAVNPDDDRYKKYIGQEFKLNFAEVPLNIKIVGDSVVDKEYGTGAVGVTPAHSMIDAEIAKRHNLPTIQVINEFGKMMVEEPTLSGKKVTDAREIIVEWLKKENLLIKEEDIIQNISTAERTGAVIEPLPKLQWFIDVNKKIPSRENKSLKELMLDAVSKDGINVLPERFERVYFNWIENLRDWCISRQIWFGHRIPVWYSKDGKTHLPKIKKIIFARHGQSESNLKKVWDGQLDSLLTNKGIEEAHKLAEKLVGRKISKIYSSDLSRAKETAKIISEKLSLPTEITSDLREVGGGKLEGKEHNGIPLLVATLTESEGETKEQLIERAQKILETISKTDEEEILIVSHNSFISVICSIIDEKSEDLITYRNNWTMENAEVKERIIISNPTQENLKQDEDTLDTWFSSGLWTFSTLGWPEETKDFKTFHPTTLIESGYDIIFFWIARMILMSKYLIGEIPFKTIYLHGLVRDSKGQKISKSLGNNVEPLEMIAKYGADAVRMSLLVGTGPGNDSKMSEEKLKAYKNFANKLWNISRFVLDYVKKYTPDLKVDFSEKDKELIRERDEFISEITKEIESYMLHIAAEKIYAYVWHRFADLIIEESKMYTDGKTTYNLSHIYSRRLFLIETLEKILIILHPFMPFVTEEIWQNMNKGSLLMVEKWPSK